MKQYYKVWFGNRTERTAAIVLDTVAYPVGKTTIEAYSRLYPYSEAPRMQRFYVGKLYPTWEQAFTEPVQKPWHNLEAR